jgi:lipopolysaccharide export system protein LptC
MNDLSIAPGTTGSGSAAWRSSSRRDMPRAFRNAARHSRRVRFLRYALPIGTVIGLVALVLVTYFNPLRALYNLPAGMGKLAVSGSKITMELPRLTGFTADSRAYELAAQAAAQDFTNPDLVELTAIRAKVEMQDKAIVEMTAANGLYDNKSEQLMLREQILLSSSSGYEGRLSEAKVDIRNGNIVSNKPVEVRMLKGVLNANRLEVKNAGDVIRFDGGVTMDVKLDPAATDAKAVAP